MKRALSHIILLFIGLTFLAIISSCCSSKDGPEHSVNSILIYISAANSLKGYAETSLQDIIDGYLPKSDNKEEILMVFYHTGAGNATLKRYKSSASGEKYEETVMAYGSDFNSSEASGFAQVLADAEAAYPANHHTLILWSHATGWLPAGYYGSPTDATSSTRFSLDYEDPYSHLVKSGEDLKSFGEDNGSEIDLIDLANALPHHYDLILFDCCLMGGIEVAYQLKEKCDYIIFSPTEILAEGFPYNIIIEKLFLYPPYNNTEGMTMVCQDYYDLYNSYSGIMRSATVSLVDCSALDGLANICKGIYDSHYDRLDTLNTSYIQQYYRGNHPWFFDLGDYVNALSDSAEYESFQKAMSLAVPFKLATDIFLNISITSYSGLSTYIPNNNYTNLNSYYRTLEWAKASDALQ